MTRAALLSLLSLLSLLPGAAAARSSSSFSSSGPTVDDFLSFPTRANLVTGAAAGGCAGLAAWVELRRGVRNVYVAQQVRFAAGPSLFFSPLFLRFSSVPFG